ncbi:PP2C family protein-serine/threonine phosphatase [Streptomyces lydicus]|uniref:PP2C family protein-serine/threonine phosphatase n=1 Tax=Streptomyces lydicus TaxID=47763 RepID=UPI0009968577|nr:PP2C family protein-serine/threonine phosphatase [Streptomyces lydicus]MDC7340754.1 PP2C family protein-serine/threonine phosphatase [Streptomyces lydicus]UEG89542.1 serine/threonine-protein phosphatase [Streptomyces lydicus]
MNDLQPTPAKVPWLLTALALVIGVLLDVLAPEPYTGLPLLAAAPLVAGATLSFRSAFAVVVVTCVVSVAVDIERGRPATPLLVDLAVVGLIGVLALGVNRLIVRQGRDLALARDVAEAVQRAVLPTPPREAGPLAVAAGYTAAQAEARIGGDFYAVQDTPFGVRLIIGDVRGKGIAAVAAVSVAIGAFRQEAEYALSLVTLAQRMDEALARAAARSGPVTSSEGFTTAVLAEVAPDGEELSLVNRGHPSPYLVQGGALVRLDPTVPQLPLGVGLGDLSAVDPVPVDVVRLPPGASLLLVTDGVTEARDKRGTFYDPVLSRRMRRHFTEPEALVDALTKDVGRWTQGAHEDDMAILAITRQRRPAPPPAA